MTDVDERPDEAQAALFPLPAPSPWRWVPSPDVDEPRRTRPIRTVYVTSGAL